MLKKNKDEEKKGFETTDLLAFKTPPGTDPTRKVLLLLMVAFEDSKNAISLRSTALKSYFFEISCTHTKSQIRLALKICLIYEWSTLISSSMTDVPTAISKLYWVAVWISLFIVLYIVTFKNLSYTVYSHVTPIAIILYIYWSINRTMNYSQEIEIKYFPLYPVLVIMFSMLPVRLEISISIFVLYVMFFEITVYTRLYVGTDSILDTYMNNMNEWGVYDKVGITSFNRTQAIELCSSFISGQTILWFAVLFVGVYLHLSNQVRRRASFLRLGQNVQNQRQVQVANRQQIKIIGQIMPEEIKDIYLSEREANKNEDMWVFTKMYDNVSILFADIVGFTNMSSNKTAPQVVTLLNDLFNRFDQLCLMTNCEKLGTLGDCYYLVAGCPNVRSDHGVCCVEMGLGMCRIIQVFNNDYKESVDMRIGVHTGRVNAAIIGNQRFRFDCYSNDVLIANTMESSGKPGRVHISEYTHEFIKHMYTFEPGDGLEVKKEIKYGVAGMKLTLINIKTYFVMAESSRLMAKTTEIEHGQLTNFQITNAKKKTVYNNEDGGGEVVVEKEEDIARNDPKAEDTLLIEALRKDSEKQVRLFERPPLWPFTLTFLDDELEFHYHNHTRNEVSPTYVDSVKLAPFIDCIASLFFTLLVTISSYYLFGEYFNDRLYILIVTYILGVINTILVFWTSINVAPTIADSTTRKFFLIATHPIARTAQSLIMCSLPCIVALCMLQPDEMHSNYMYTNSFFSIALISVLGHGMYISSFALINSISAFLYNLVFTLLLVLHPEGATVDPCYEGKCAVGICVTEYTKHFDRFWYPYGFLVISYFLIKLFVILNLNRENEKNLRLCFYVTREAQKRSEEAKRAMMDSLQVLHNIIPEYALNAIEARGGDITKAGNFSYAVNVKNSAVIFSCLTNFFSSYYREDYKGGEGALKLLNKIICMFDDLLLKSHYATVEKIKTINDCYMVAAGLNVALVAKSKDSKKHLRALLDYCFDMQRALTRFNADFIIGSDKFEMKIGYNIGPVTAGVIGTTKPLYDIWGDTVNVASRMYSTGSIGTVQVPEKVQLLLENYYNFTSNGVKFVKGKGDMKTFLVEEKFNMKHREAI